MAVNLQSRTDGRFRAETERNVDISIDGVTRITVMSVYDDEDYKSVHNFHRSLVISTDAGDEIEIRLDAHTPQALKLKTEEEPAAQT